MNGLSTENLQLRKKVAELEEAFGSLQDSIDYIREMEKELRFLKEGGAIIYYMGEKQKEELGCRLIEEARKKGD